MINTKEAYLNEVKVAKHKSKTVENQFLHISPIGNLMYGDIGFAAWAQIYQKNKSIDSLIVGFESTHSLTYAKQKTVCLISHTKYVKISQKKNK